MQHTQSIYLEAVDAVLSAKADIDALRPSSRAEALDRRRSSELRAAYAALKRAEREFRRARAAVIRTH